MLNLQFETDNAAFEDNLGGECARILRDVAGKITEGRTDGQIYDANGNRVGDWHLDVPEDDEEA